MLRDFWDLPPEQRTPAGVAELVRTSWIDVGFRDPEQSVAWRMRVREVVTDYLRTSDRERQPVGIERSVSLKTDEVAITGRIDRLDDRDGELVVVDYKTGRQVPTDDDARTSLPLALYAVASSRMFRRPCRRVELHHVPTGTVAAHEHTDESLAAQGRRGRVDRLRPAPRRRRLRRGRRRVDPLRPAALRAVLVVRLPGALPGGPGPGAREVRLGRPRALRVDRQERPVTDLRAAFVAATDHVAAIVSREDVAAAWHEQSALAEWEVGGLVAHLASQPVTDRGAAARRPDRRPDPARGALRPVRLGQASLDDEVNVSIRESGDARAADGPDAVLAAVIEAREALPDLLAAQPDGRAVLIPWAGWSLGLDDFLTGRLMEVVVHGEDVAASVGFTTPPLPRGVLDPVLALLTRLAVTRHGQGAVVSALTRAERAPRTISAF